MPAAEGSHSSLSVRQYCCRAGAVAWPGPCPWHPAGERPRFTAAAPEDLDWPDGRYDAEGVPRDMGELRVWALKQGLKAIGYGMLFGVALCVLILAIAAIGAAL